MSSAQWALSETETYVSGRVVILDHQGDGCDRHDRETPVRLSSIGPSQPGELRLSPATIASIAFGIDREHHRLAPGHRLPTGRHGGPHAPRNRCVIELKTTGRQPLQEPLRRRELHPRFAFGMALKKSNRHSLPTFVIRLMRFTLEVPIVYGAIYTDGAAVALGSRHRDGSSMLARPKHRFGALVQTDRPVQQRWRANDLDSYAATCSDPDVMRYLEAAPRDWPKAD